ncbi:MAG: CoA-binding protein, partial [Pirellulaceae bacterium]
MSTRHLNRLFQPRSIAVIGASPNQPSLGRTVLANLIDETFAGPVYPVNPRYTEVEGRPCYR